MGKEILPGTATVHSMIDRPVVYRPRGATVGMMAIVGLLTVPVAALVSSRSWVIGLIFDCVDTLQIVMHGGKAHHVSWIATAPVQRIMGTLGPG